MIALALALCSLYGMFWSEAAPFMREQPATSSFVASAILFCAALLLNAIPARITRRRPAAASTLGFLGQLKAGWDRA